MTGQHNTDIKLVVFSLQFLKISENIPLYKLNKSETMLKTFIFWIWVTRTKIELKTISLVC